MEQRAASDLHFTSTNVEVMPNSQRHDQLGNDMMLIKRCALLAACFLAACTPAQTERAEGPPVEVVRAAFGLFNPPGTGQQPFVPATVVPLVVNQGYGWMMVIKTD